MRNNDLKKNFYYMYTHDSMCDGMMEEAGFFDYLYPLFILSGMIIFMQILRYWYRVKDKVKNEK